MFLTGLQQNQQVIQAITGNSAGENHCFQTWQAQGKVLRVLVRKTSKAKNCQSAGLGAGSDVDGLVVIHGGNHRPEQWFLQGYQG